MGTLHSVNQLRRHAAELEGVRVDIGFAEGDVPGTWNAQVAYHAMYQGKPVSVHCMVHWSYDVSDLQRTTVLRHLRTMEALQEAGRLAVLYNGSPVTLSSEAVRSEDGELEVMLDAA